jgi:hypothetical protein
MSFAVSGKGGMQKERVRMEAGSLSRSPTINRENLPAQLFAYRSRGLQKINPI